MSRIGRRPIPVPSGVEVTLSGTQIQVKGPRGHLEMPIPVPITVRKDSDALLVERPSDNRIHRALHGLTRALVANMVTGVTSGFKRQLEIQGVGYRAAVQGDALNIEVGYSHPIRYELPKGISATVERNVMITLEGIDKQLLGETAAKIRSFRPPEPYKGKGIRYLGEFVRRKVGKKNA
ncbi:MAG TPA: 50S ribosomal protein L6 [bacterium]|nr:50S ribosomal protein L6 [bacterium]HPO07664.1 50S ribosomal protein L6 [bacterium]HQO33981.1 50S ribosomal protein L6 [bacterium]HQQ00317.1 50S ribosomal protein L6 [bacterium]